MCAGRVAATNSSSMWSWAERVIKFTKSIDPEREDHKASKARKMRRKKPNPATGREDVKGKQRTWKNQEPAPTPVTAGLASSRSSAPPSKPGILPPICFTPEEHPSQSSTRRRQGREHESRGRGRTVSQQREAASVYRNSFKASIIPNPPSLEIKNMNNRRNWRLIDVQALIPTLWTRNSNRSERASPVRVV